MRIRIKHNLLNACGNEKWSQEALQKTIKRRPMFYAKYTSSVSHKIFKKTKQNIFILCYHRVEPVKRFWKKSYIPLHASYVNVLKVATV